jgi:hypothetical protein
MGPKALALLLRMMLLSGGGEYPQKRGASMVLVVPARHLEIRH